MSHLASPNQLNGLPGAGVEGVVAPLVLEIEQQEHARRQPDGEAGHMDGGVAPFAGKAAEGVAEGGHWEGSLDDEASSGRGTPLLGAERARGVGQGRAGGEHGDR